MRDAIVEELRKVRDEHAARFNYDIDAIFEDFKESEKASGLPLITLQPRRLSKTREPNVTQGQIERP
jgi:hypothetical protein